MVIITNLYYSNSHGLFTTSIVKALDVWMSVCLVYVFAAFLEYAILHTINTRQVNKGHRSLKSMTSSTTGHLSYSKDIESTNLVGEISLSLPKVAIFSPNSSSRNFPVVS